MLFLPPPARVWLTPIRRLPVVRPKFKEKTKFGTCGSIVSGELGAEVCAKDVTYIECWLFRQGGVEVVLFCFKK